MNESLMFFAISWAILACVVLALAIYRKVVALAEDDSLHLAGPSMETQQTTVAHRLDVIDRWGKILTVAVLAYGIVLAGVYVYFSWAERNRVLG